MGNVMTFDEKRNLINKVVSNFLNDNYFQATHFGEFDFRDGEKEHIVNTGTEILMRKWNILPYESGSFVESVVSNDLMGAFGNADVTNKKAILFYTLLIYHVGMPAAIL